VDGSLHEAVQISREFNDWTGSRMAAESKEQDKVVIVLLKEILYLVGGGRYSFSI